MNSSLKSALAATIALSLLPAFAFAQSKNQGYVTDTNGNVVMATGANVCVRTGYWTPALAAAAEACKQCTPELCPKPPAAPPAKKEATPPPKPVVPPKKAEPAKPVPQKINFAADALFDFDKSELKPRGKAMLDDLVNVLQGATYEVILAIGHTDRIGSAQYNQKLSVKRAEAVKQYLVGKGIAANRVYAEGKGKTQPVTKPGDCKGKHAQALIACLQPDRRVDVEVTGTK